MRVLPQVQLRSPHILRRAPRVAAPVRALFERPRGTSDLIHAPSGVGRFLVTNVLAAVDKDAKSHGKKACDAVFLETNDADKVSAEKDVMDPKIRHKVLIQLGFSILNFNYVQPALSPEQGKVRAPFLQAPEIRVE